MLRISSTTARDALRGLLLAGVLLLAGFLPASAQNAVYGPGVQQTLDALGPLDKTTVVVTFDGDGPLTDAQLNAVAALGINEGIYFSSLPIAGLVATSNQVANLASRADVRSVWLNTELTYFNQDSRALTGVDRVQNDADLRNGMGLPLSGKGIGVVVHDSGIDANLPDLEYGRRVKQNVQAAINLKALGEDTPLAGLLPITYLENQRNTDLGSGHGTHVAGTVGGSGVSSAGAHAGVAPGADLLGYGSGAVLFILDAIGGFDWAITHQFEYNIRVITNSWGSSGTFDPANPVNVASYNAYKRGMTVLFAAGNSGPIDDSHNPYAQALWVISVAAGTKAGTLADFSSRGLQGETGTFTQPDGSTWTYVNEPAVVAPGVAIISSRATTGALPVLSAEEDVNALGANAAFYSLSDGTSMATPHVAGIAALLLEADPSLSPLEVKDILKATATNMPARESWEVGSGYVNAYAAVVQAMGKRSDFGTILNTERTFNSNVDLRVTSEPITIDYNPRPELSADANRTTVEVEGQLAQLIVKVTADGVAGETGNAIYPVFIAPDGTEYAGGTTLLFPIDYARAQVVDNPMEGTWTVEIRGIQSGTGNNVVSVPEVVEGTVIRKIIDAYDGLDDVAGHPAATAIQVAVFDKLVDGEKTRRFRPGDNLRRIELAEYLVMGTGIRQHRPVDGSDKFSDVRNKDLAFAEAVTAQGAALKDKTQWADGVMLAENGAFEPRERVARYELAYALVQALGLQEMAQSFSGDVTVQHRTERVPVTDADAIPAGFRGYVQLALDLGLMPARFSLTQGPYDLKPTVTATFDPDGTVTRADFAVAATRFLVHFE